MIVADLMHGGVKTIATDATVAEAVPALMAADVSALPVLDRFGRAVGVFSAREVLRAENRCSTAADRERLFERTLVVEIMAPWPGVIHPDMSLKTAAEQLLARRTHRLFVEERGRLVGVLSQTDIVGAVAAAHL